MAEKELKDSINVLRQEIAQKEKQIKELYKEINIYKKDADLLRAKRDEATEKANKLGEEAKKFTASRDELNDKIAELKNKRGELVSRIRGITKSIRETKGMRDKLNKTAKGTDRMLLSLYSGDLGVLLNKDIPLEEEIRIFEKVFELGERVEVAKQADEVHKSIIENYDSVQELKKELDLIHEHIQKIACDSQEYHENAMKIYKDVSLLRKESDENHKKLLEKYDAMNPLRDRVRDIKGEIKTIQEKLSPHLQEMDKIRFERESKKRDRDILEAKEKLQASKRLSLNDFRLLLERGELDLENEEEDDSGAVENSASDSSTVPEETPEEGKDS